MIKVASFSLLLFISGTVFAQQLDHSLAASRGDVLSKPKVAVQVPDTLRILAVMVQFQEDTDARTSGNGRFDLTTPATPAIDSPPHNRRYFQDHLLFAENYFQKSSKGKLIIQFTVVDSVFTLSKLMSAYSPPKNGSNIALGNLAVETWQKVDSSGLVPNFSDYNAFIVFHAGVGRDINLVATLGYDPTPFDIPSLYLGPSSFKELFGAAYQGIPVNNGTFHIANSIILPETETRLIPGTPSDFLLNLSINGLLCASIGSHLGLPDLFDTHTGRSGIGRFGLMDGQAIFSFSGVFPPEPSAWEKYWLGWLTPITLGRGEITATLPAASISDTVYRIPISGQEYFLLENRNRDPQRNGQKVTSVYQGVTKVQIFSRDTTGFHAFNLSALSGVVTDVEDLDWSLPGGVTTDGTFFDGGALIWHIDESVIAQRIRSNGVNANPLRRGVDVEEADGSQDIGQEYEFLSAGSGSEEGTPLDFWYTGNASPLFKNEFSSKTFPNSLSNGGANSLVTIKNFSPRGARMTATVVLGDQSLAPLEKFPKLLGEVFPPNAMSVAILSPGVIPSITVSTTGEPIQRATASGNVPTGMTAGKIFAWKPTGDPALPFSSTQGLIAVTGSSDESFSAGVSILAKGTDPVRFMAGQTKKISPPPTNPNLLPGKLRSFVNQDANGDSLADDAFSIQLGRSITSDVLITDSMIVFGGSRGRGYFVRHDGSNLDSIMTVTDSLAAVVGVSKFETEHSFIFTGSDGTVTRMSRSPDGSVSSEAVSKSFGREITGPAVSGFFGSSSNGKPGIAFLTKDGFLYLVDRMLIPFSGFPVNLRESVSSSPALADVDGDGIRDVIVFGGKKIFVYNIAGALLDNFPVTVRSNESIASVPVIADLNGDGKVEVVAVTTDGIVFGYDKNGKMPVGFPLQAGTGRQSVAVFDVPTLSLSSIGIGLAVASSDGGSVSAWQTGTRSQIVPYNEQVFRPWAQYQKDARRSGSDFTPIPASPLSSQFFPPERAYNWPNPVYDGKTYLRYFVKENATVTIKIFDLAGDAVGEISNPPGIGGVDNEVEWNVSGIQSGIYFARIEAAAPSGSGVAIVKVAVVK